MFHLLNLLSTNIDKRTIILESSTHFDRAVSIQASPGVAVSGSINLLRSHVPSCEAMISEVCIVCIIYILSMKMGLLIIFLQVGRPLGEVVG